RLPPQHPRDRRVVHAAGRRGGTARRLLHGATQVPGQAGVLAARARHADVCPNGPGDRDLPGNEGARADRHLPRADPHQRRLQPGVLHLDPARLLLLDPGRAGGGGTAGRLRPLRRVGPGHAAVGGAVRAHRGDLHVRRGVERVRRCLDVDDRRGHATADRRHHQFHRGVPGAVAVPVRGLPCRGRPGGRTVRIHRALPGQRADRGQHQRLGERHNMAAVQYEAATRRYPGSERAAVDALDLEIEDGEFLVLIGPSGCGKSTSLRMLAGLEPLDDGAIRIGDRDVTNLAPKQRDIAMVFQNYALYPHMTVAENMGFALKIAGKPKSEIKQRVAEAAKLLDLEQFLDRKPKALSGGQRQRVAMGRAIVREPQVFLMDEPLSNLDAKLRVSTRTQIAALQRRLGTTTVYVTHDQVEAMTMGDRVALLQDGVLQQCDTPRALYEKPANTFVAGFIGSPAMNLHTAKITDGGVQIAGVTVPVPRATIEAAVSEGSDSSVLGFRPEALEVVSADTQPGGFPATVQVVEELGSDAFCYTTLPGHDAAGGAGGVDVIARVDARTPPQKGETLHLRIRPEEAHAFSTVTGNRLPS